MKLRPGRSSSAMRPSRAGRSSSLAVRGRLEASSVSTRCSRRRAWEVGTPGSSSSTASTTSSPSGLLVAYTMRTPGSRSRISENSWRSS